MEYQSFTTTPNKLKYIYNGLTEIQQNIIDLPSILASYSSTNTINGVFTYQLIKDYEVDYETLDLITPIPEYFYFQFIFLNTDASTASLISFVPIFYSTNLLDTSSSFYNNFYQTWEYQIDSEGNNIMIANIAVVSELEDDDGNDVPSFMNLYLVMPNNRIYYNV